MEVSHDKQEKDLYQNGLLHHSDLGITCTSTQYRDLLNQYKMISSVIHKDNCHDNAVTQNFLANLKNELIYHRDYKTREEARSAIFFITSNYIIIANANASNIQISNTD